MKLMEKTRMKKLRLPLIISLLLIGIMVMSGQPAIAQSGPEFTKVEKPFSVSSASPARDIPVGSTINHRTDGITVVTGPDGARLLMARDADAATIETPKGPASATRVYYIPSGAQITRYNQKVWK